MCDSSLGCWHFKKEIEKLLTRWNSRVVEGRFGGVTPSPGPENTLAGVGGPARPGAFLPASFPVCLLVHLCSLQECTLHLLSTLTTYLHVSPHHQLQVPRKVLCPSWALVLIHETAGLGSFSSPSPTFVPPSLVVKNRALESGLSGCESQCHHFLYGCFLTRALVFSSVKWAQE